MSIIVSFRHIAIDRYLDRGFSIFKGGEGGFVCTRKKKGLKRSLGPVGVKV
ncbi:hypothetical protein [Mycoplana azooxidifex]|uniref:hypothetical protein n=1 Tax=Mycoplana azooxidifex TaxID=1636188 RepID=UPI00160C77CD|nr:hypothetical protein [Mycoplana azooxidifex]